MKIDGLLIWYKKEIEIHSHLGYVEKENCTATVEIDGENEKEVSEALYLQQSKNLSSLEGPLYNKQYQESHIWAITYIKLQNSWKSVASFGNT